MSTVRSIAVSREVFTLEPETTAKLLAEQVRQTDPDDLWVIAVTSTPDHRRFLDDLLFMYGRVLDLEPET